jgi:membrane dipeptidase
MTRETGPATLADLPSVSDGILCDILLGPPPGEYMDHLQRMRGTGFSHISLSMAGDDEGPAAIYAAMVRMRRQLSLEPDKYILVDSVDDIRTAKKSGKLSIGFHFQGTEAIGRDLANVGGFYKLGVRWMLMAYNFQNNVGTGCVEAQRHDAGLTDFGRELIKEMNRVGMFVDCTHSGYRTTMEAMEASTQPCIFSHSNPRALHEHPRNITDDQIKACAQTGGIIGVNGVGHFMGENGEVSADAVVRQIDHIAQLVGSQHVAFGLDYMTPQHSISLVAANGGDTTKYAMPREVPWKFFHPKDTPQLLSKLLNRGYSAEDVRGIMGGNFLRVAEKVWR